MCDLRHGLIEVVGALDHLSLLLFEQLEVVSGVGGSAPLAFDRNRMM